MTYMVCDGDGYALTDGLQDHDAARVAQSIANQRLQSVWLSESDSEEMGEEFSPDEDDPIVAARMQLEAWDPDDARDDAGRQSTINDVFHAIYERWPESDDDALDEIYAARDSLDADEARGVLYILWPSWPGFAARKEA